MTSQNRSDLIPEICQEAPRSSPDGAPEGGGGGETRILTRNLQETYAHTQIGHLQEHLQDLQDHLQDLRDHLQDLQKPTRKLPESYNKLQKSGKNPPQSEKIQECLGNP